MLIKLDYQQPEVEVERRPMYLYPPFIRKVGFHDAGICSQIYQQLGTEIQIQLIVIDVTFE